MSVKRVLVGEQGMARAVEQQMRNWELGREQRQAQPQERRKELEDFVCVSRMVGLEGHQVVAGLAARLGWPVFDREVLGLMAGDDEMTRKLYETLDHRDLKWWESALSPFVMGRYMANDYFRRLCETVLALARQSPGIFVGRGIDLVLPPKVGLRVCLYAGLPARIRAVAERHGIGETEAKLRIQQGEAERREFIQRMFHVEPFDPGRFDLVVNLDRMSDPEAVDLILGAHERRAARSAAQAPAATSV